MSDLSRQLALFSVPGRSRADKSQLLLRRRCDRLTTMTRSIHTANQSLRKLAELSTRSTVKIRPGFVCNESAVSAEASDRKALARHLRPPATRLISSRGAALRLILIILYEVQLRSRPGSHYENIRPIYSDAGKVGWLDLLATNAKPSGEGASYMSATAKKARQLRQTLDRLHSEKLVELPRQAMTRNIHEMFRLLHETGSHSYGSRPYQVPRSRESTFPLPVQFFTNGWIHVLEDTEIAFLLIASFMDSQTRPGDAFLISPKQRALQFGLGRDAYGAHKALQAMGLLEATEVDHMNNSSRDVSNGNVVPPLAFKFRPHGFQADGLTRVLRFLDSTIR